MRRSLNLVKHKVKVDELKLVGIVIKAFTEPFILPEELYEAVEKLASRVEYPADLRNRQALCYTVSETE